MKPVDTLFPALQASHRHMIISEDETSFLLEGHCPITKKVWTLAVNKKGYLAWVGGELIQKALPTLSDDERELILSGTSPEGWSLLFGPEE